MATPETADAYLKQVQVPNLTPVMPQTSISQPNIIPQTSNLQPNLTPLIPQTSIPQPNFTPVIPQTYISQPNLTPVIPQTSILQPNLTPIIPQTSISQPNFTPVVPQTSISQPNLTPVIPQTSILQPNLTPVIPQTSILQPNLTPVIPQTSIPQPNLTSFPQTSIPDYINKCIPVISCCKQGTAPGQFSWPEGLAIEPQSGRIFIADCINNKVQVYSPDGEYCFMFGTQMDGPWNVFIASSIVYVSQCCHCLTLYELDGEYIIKIGSEGTSNGEFKSPKGIAVSSTSEHIYVCDAGNNRVQIFNESRKYHSQFGNNSLNQPRDINLSNDSLIVLDAGNPCIHIFCITDCSLLNSIISRGSADAQIADSYHFTMDGELNLILTDCGNHCIKVFSNTGDFIAQICERVQAIGELSYPNGIAIDRQNRIIVVSDNNNCSLQIF